MQLLLLLEFGETKPSSFAFGCFEQEDLLMDIEKELEKIVARIMGVC